LGDLDIDDRIKIYFKDMYIKMDLTEKDGVRVWKVFSWLRIRSSVGQLYTHTLQ
jgi:hypothetical protein